MTPLLSLLLQAACTVMTIGGAPYTICVTPVKAVAPAPPAPTYQTWYVRPDGGTRYTAARIAANMTGQCDGLADAPYPGTGVNQHCAFNDYRFLWDDQATYGVTKWVIAGGDDVILSAAAQWRVGFSQGATSNDPWCFGGQGPFGCVNPTIPSGTAAKHTRILGQNYASCNTGKSPNRSVLTQVFGGFGAYTPVNLAGAKYVDVECLEITRHSNCGFGGETGAGQPAWPLCSKTAPLDDYDSDGIVEDASTSNVILQDLWIHGHPGRGVKGPIGGKVSATRVDIIDNESAGWDFDDGNATPMGAGAEWDTSYLTIAYSGCYEEYPIVDPIPAAACFGQSNQGYGDGVGSAPGQHFIVNIDHSSFHHNTQDGNDLGHMDGGHEPLSFTNSYSYANNGAALKWGSGFDKVTVTGNLLMANCERMSAPIAGALATYDANLADFCRSNDALSFNFSNTTALTMTGNTIITTAPTTFDYHCAPYDSQANCDSSTWNMTGNTVLGYTEPPANGNTFQAPASFCGASCNNGATDGNGNDAGKVGTVTRSGNTYFGLRDCPANVVTSDSVKGASTGEVCADPKLPNEPPQTPFTESILDVFN